MNTFGNIFRITSAGESHGKALVGIVDGMPAGIKIDFEQIRRHMSYRRPGSGLGSKRREADEPVFLSGLLDGVTTGTPIAFMIENTNQLSNDYDHLRHTFRPSHADYTYQAKYGIRDWRGGGRSSARETALRVCAGAMAMQVLERRGITVSAYTSQIGQIAFEHPYEAFTDEQVYSQPSRCPDERISGLMEAEVKFVQEEGDTVGGIVACVATGVPVGLGEPIYGKLSAMLASAMMSINAAHGFEYGMGFEGAAMRGSMAIDPFIVKPDGRVGTSANNSGGIQGGISNGAPITMRVAFKPVATLMQPVESINLKGEVITIEPRGRHDACVVPRAVPVVRAMAAITVLDALMMANSSKIF